MFIRGYLRASTDEQDAYRSKSDLKAFADSKGVQIASFYTENVSGAKAQRAELERLMEDSHKGDVILIEKMDRLTRLKYEHWKNLRYRLQHAGLNIVVLDQPMTHAIIDGNEESSMLAKVLTEFMIDLGAAMARDDYETRRKRQAQGIKKAKHNGIYTGRKPDQVLRENIKALLVEGKSYTTIQRLLNCSRSTIAKVKKLP